MCRRGKPSEPDTHLESYIQIFLHEDVQKHLMVFLERAKEQHKQDDVQVRAPLSPVKHRTRGMNKLTEGVRVTA